MRFFKLNFLFAALLLLGMSSCRDDETRIDEVDVSDSDAVTELMEFKNVEASSQNGSLPASSTDPEAPVLIEEYSQTSFISGSDFLIDFFEDTGAELKGMYLQVEGAEAYFNISLESTSSNGRIAGSSHQSILRNRLRTKEMVEQIVFKLPHNMAAGTFCVTFAVYDVEERVSNYVDLCIEVLKPGGAESEFLSADKWSLIYEKRTSVFGDEYYEEWDSVGVAEFESYTYTIQCDDQSLKEIEEISEVKTEFIHITFSSDGKYVLQEKWYEKYLDDEKTTCDNLVYEEDAQIYEEEGAWSYNKNTKILTLVYTDVFEEDGVEMQDVDVIEFGVKRPDNAHMILTFEQSFEFGTITSEMFFQSIK